jgi:glycosyltransferase involved in cell wall biosynthesis
MTKDLLESLAARGHEVTLFVDELQESIEVNGVSVHRGGDLYTTFVNDRDVFITHPEIRLRGQVWAKKLPYIAIIHNTSTTTMRSIERMPPALTIANSEYTASKTPEAARRTSMGLHVIHPPTVMTEVRSIARRKYVTLVNVSEPKGADVFFDLALNNPHLEFLGVEGGHGVQETSELDNVTIMPSTRDMSTVYAQTRVLLFPSKIETYGKVVGEAMAYAIPVIASDLPGIREAGGDAAIYCEPDDVDAWRDALDSVDRVVEFRHRSKSSADRAAFLHERSEADLDRFEALLEETAWRHRHGE